MRCPRPLLILATMIPMLPLGPGCRAQRSAPEDSVRREILLLGVREAELEAERTDLWHRLIPRIEFSAGVGVRDLLFAEAEAAPAFILPRDSYRLSVALSVSGLIDGVPHERALIALGRRRSELFAAEARGRESRRLELLQEAREDSLRSILEEELAIRQEGVRYHATLFEQGRTGFDDLLRSKLALLEARRSLLFGVRWGDPPREER